MLSSYHQNSSIGMTKSAYYDMCDMLGTEPNEDDVPIEIEDFPELVQKALHVYSLLPDIWEGMNGTYMGKDLSIFPLLIDIYDIEKYETIIMLDLISTIDGIRKKAYKENTPKNPKT